MKSKKISNESIPLPYREKPYTATPKNIKYVVNMINEEIKATGFSINHKLNIRDGAISLILTNGCYSNIIRNLLKIYKGIMDDIYDGKYTHSEFHKYCSEVVYWNNDLFIKERKKEGKIISRGFSNITKMYKKIKFDRYLTLLFISAIMPSDLGVYRF
jgi:hypothetical protein